jgi:uncharacterized protein with ATP-grasp and redox domains
MKAKPECIACVFRQALNTARVATRDLHVQHQILTAIAANPCCLNLDQQPTRLCQPVYSTVAKLAGVPDPYFNQKEETNKAALELLPELRRRLTQSTNPLDVALHAAVAGNIIDLGIGHAFDLHKDVLALLQVPFAVNHTTRFQEELQPGRRLLYLGDNAGEIVFDTLLVEHLLAHGLHITYTVKSGPIINDAMMKDAHDAGMTRLVPVIETGSDDIGVNWDRVSPEFRHAYDSADVVLAKGHGNFETCDDYPGNFYFLLKAKCPVVADTLGVHTGDIVFASGQELAKRIGAPADLPQA